VRAAKIWTGLEVEVVMPGTLPPVTDVHASAVERLWRRPPDGCVWTASGHRKPQRDGPLTGGTRR
jgi:hypothetical protein